MVSLVFDLQKLFVQIQTLTLVLYKTMVLFEKTGEPDV